MRLPTIAIKNPVRKILLCFALLCFALPEFATAQEENPQIPSTVRVKMGDHVFAIPRKSGSIYLAKGQESIQEWGRQKPNDPPFEVTRVGFFPTDFSGYSYNTRGKDGMFFAPQLLVHTSPSPYDSYEKVIEKLENEHKKLESLPKEGNFYAFPMSGGFIYIPVEARPLTPKGNPIAFGCHLHFHECSTSFAWKDDVQVGIRQVGLDFVPREKWENFYEILLTYLEKLEVEK